MLPLEIRKYLYDIQQACELLNDFTAGKTLTDYAANAMLRAAVERQFEIIGEAPQSDAQTGTGSRSAPQRSSADHRVS